MDFCRFCLSNFNQNNSNFSAKIQINEEIESQFKDATNTELLPSNFHNFPKFSCQKCLENLKICVKLKRTFIENQKILYQQFEDKKWSKNYLGNEKTLLNPPDGAVQVSVSKTFSIDVSQKENSKELIVPRPKAQIQNVEIPKNHNDQSSVPVNLNINVCQNESIETATALSTKEQLQNVEASKTKDIKAQKVTAPGNITKIKANFDLKEISLRKSSKDSKTICPNCGILVKHQNLQQHINIVHLKIKNYICDVCNKRFYLKPRLKGHLMKHFNITDAHKSLNEQKRRDLIYDYRKAHPNFQKTQIVQHFIALGFKRNTIYENLRRFDLNLESLRKRGSGRHCGLHDDIKLVQLKQAIDDGVKSYRELGKMFNVHGKTVKKYLMEVMGIELEGRSKISKR